MPCSYFMLNIVLASCYVRLDWEEISHEIKRKQQQCQRLTKCEKERMLEEAKYTVITKLVVDENDDTTIIVDEKSALFHQIHKLPYSNGGADHTQKLEHA
mmetsp:Transcript_14653/g.21661  ORF Transcript_14653/g.21661 Transcript_14653/m.21661 type:complete len:100 (+) Transcript_14653:408-707(+)